MSDKYRELEEKEAEFEVDQLARDTVGMGTATAIGIAVGGPVGGTLALAASAAGAIIDKFRREREREGD